MTTPVSGGDSQPPLVLGGVQLSPELSQYIRNLEAQDTSSTSTTERMSLLAFTQAITAAIDTANSQAWQNMKVSLTNRENFYIGLIGDAAHVAAMYQEALKAITSSLIPISNADDTNVSDLNSALNTYNSSVVPNDQSAIDTMNGNIAAYNAGSITTAQYNAAVAAYNAYVASRNSSITVTATSDALNSFNSSTVAINAEVTDFNNTYLDIFGAPTVAGQTPYGISTAPALIPTDTSPPAVAGSIATISASIPLAAITNTISPSPATLSETISSILSMIAGTSKSCYEHYSSQDRYAAYVQFVLQNINVTLPPAFKSRSPILDSGYDGPMAAGSADLSSLILSRSHPLMERLIDSANYIKNTTRLDLVAIQLVPKLLLFASQTILGKLGLLAGATAYNQQIGLSPITKSPPTSLLVSQAYAQEISTAVSKGVVQTATSNVLSQALPGAPANALSTLSNSLANATELSYLSTGLLLLAQSLGFPSLSAQLLATIPQASSSKLLNIQPLFTSVFATPGSVAPVQAALTSYLTSNVGLEAQHAQTIAQNAINNAVNSNATTDANTFAQNLQADLASQGLTSFAAQAAALYAANFVQAELIGSQVLNTDITQGSFSQGTLPSALTQSIINTNGGVVSGRNLRDQLAASFTAQGTSPDQAILAATLAVTGSNAPIPAQTLDELEQNLRQHVIDATKGLTTSQSNQLADQIVALVLGNDRDANDVSLRSQMAQILQNFNSTKDQMIAAQVDDVLRPYLNPDMSITKYADELRDPANTFLLSAQASGDMYARPEPTNYLKNISIHV